MAEELIRRKITSPRHLGIMGGSNGGLLVGVALTQRPELFNAVVVQVPLLDMQGYSQLLAGASWMAEKMFQTIVQRSGNGGPEWLSDHPSPANRYAAINREAALLGFRGSSARSSR